MEELMNTATYNGDVQNVLNSENTYPWRPSRGVWREVPIPGEDEKLVITFRGMPQQGAETNPAGYNSVLNMVDANDLIWLTFGTGLSVTVSQRPAGGPNGDYWGDVSMGQTGEPVPGTPGLLNDAFGDITEIWTYTLNRPAVGNPSLDVTGSKHGAAVWHWMSPIASYAGMRMMIGWCAPETSISELFTQTGVHLSGCVDVEYLSVAIESI
jgi:hypothetical protein